MGKKTTTLDIASQTQAGSEQGSAQAAAANLQGNYLGSGNTISFSQVTTDAGVIAAAAAAGQALIKAQEEAQRQATALGLRSLESTQTISENLLSRAAEKSAGEPTEEAKNAKTVKIAILAAAALLALYFLRN